MRNLAFTSDSPQSIKLGDSNDTLSLRVTELDQPVDLSRASSITVKIGNTAGFLTEIDVAVSSLIHPTDGRIDVVIDSKISSELPAGQYLLEVWINDAQGNTTIYPDTSYPSVIGFSIKKNIMAATSTVVATLTLADFEAKFDDMQKDLQNKVTSGYFKGDKGTDGVDGKDGVGISSTVVTYQLSTSGSTAPTGAWSSTALSPTTASPYLWIQTVITYSDSSTKTLYTISVKGDKGDKGDTGTVDNAGLTNAPAFQALQAQVNNSAVGTNLLLGTSGTLQTVTNAIGSASNLPLYTPTVTKVDINTTYTARTWVSPASHDMRIQLGFYDSSGIRHFVIGNTISAGTSGYSTWTGIIPAGSNIQATTVAFTTSQSTASSVSYKEFKLEEGSVATDWSPNPTEILTQSDYAKIKAAIVALGGSLS